MKREGRYILIPEKILILLKNNRLKYKGSKKINGYKVYDYIINNNNKLSLEYVEKVKHMIENDNKKTKFLLGGDVMLNWVNKILNNITEKNEKQKDVKQTIGLKNSHIKSHTKNNNRIVKISEHIYNQIKNKL